MPFGSNPMHHMLAAYQAALAAVALGQLDALKAMPGGPQGLMDLVTLCPVVAEVRMCGYWCMHEKAALLWLPRSSMWVQLLCVLAQVHRTSTA